MSAYVREDDDFDAIEYQLEQEHQRMFEELEARRDFKSGGRFALDQPDGVPALWGKDPEVLWSEGEACLIVAPTGLGKTTLAQNLVLRMIGVIHEDLLGFPVKRIHEPVLYCALDRPRQAARSLRRMVGEEDRAKLDAQLAVWDRPLPFNALVEPEAFAEWCLKIGAHVVVIDSLKDVAAKLTDDETGLALSRLFNVTVTSGIELLVLHHNRKGAPGVKAKSIDDVYGSTFITAACGSVIALSGDPSDPVFTFSHLKSPAEQVDSFDVQHESSTGTLTIHGKVTAFDALRQLDGIGGTAADVAFQMYGGAPDTHKPTKADENRARRALEKLVKDGVAHKDDGKTPARYVLTQVGGGQA